ncbi:MAG: hypothetical protein AAFN10_25825, partial [Bacteroidota bacterium]
FKGKSSFKTYLSNILIRRSQDFLSKKIKNRERFSTQNESYWEHQMVSESSDVALDENEILKLVRHIFSPDASASEAKSECLSIYEYLARGFDWESIATRINRSVQAAKNKRSRCFDQLVSALRDQFPQERQVLASMYHKIAKDYE